MKIYNILTIIIFIISNFSYSQFDLEKNGNILYQFSFAENFEVFKNNKKNTYFITDENKKILVKKLKFCENLNGYILQALDKKNRIVYFNEKLEKVERPSQIVYLVCGTVASYKFELIKKGNEYLVKKNTDNQMIGMESTEEIVISFPDEDYEKIYFINHKDELNFDENTTYPYFLIFERKSKFGIIDNSNIYFYDKIETQNNYLKVQRDGLWNYYNISKQVRYKILDSFIDELAYFELPNGTSGYLDKSGNEYYK